MPDRIATLLVPGLLCTGRLFKHQFQNLIADTDVEVADISRADTIEQIAAGILADAPERFAVAGLSMGGAIALEMVKQAPLRVIRLALLNSSPLPDSPASSRQREQLMNLAQASGTEAVAKQLLPRLLTEKHLLDPNLTGTVLQMARETPVEVFVRHEKAQMKRPDARPLLAAIRCPTQIIAGREDRLTPPEISEEMANSIPGAKLSVLDSCAHLSALEQAERVSDALRQWLELDEPA